MLLGLAIRGLVMTIVTHKIPYMARQLSMFRFGTN